MSSLRSSERNRCRYEYILQPMTIEQFLHNTAYRLRTDMAIDMDHQAFAGVLVEDGQHFETPTADRLIVDKIPGPNLAGLFGLGRQPGENTPAPMS